MEPLQPPPQAQHKLDSDGQVFIWEAGPGLIAEDLPEALPAVFGEIG